MSRRDRRVVYSDGEALNYEAVEASARHRGIAIRGGCFCNPGASERAFGVNAAHARDCVHGKFSVAQFRACMDGKAVGALRASLGVATSEADIDRLLELVAELTGREVRPVTSFSGRRPL